MTDLETLVDFLSIPLGDSSSVLKRSAALPGADHRGRAGDVITNRNGGLGADDRR